MMDITFMACLLAVTSAMGARAAFVSCPELCKSNVYPDQWPNDCHCPLDDDSLFRAKELEDNGIYFEPTDIYTLQRLSFISPPFYILNPVLKLDSGRPKIIKMEKLSHSKHFNPAPSLSTAVTTTKPASYLDVDVKDIVDISRSTYEETGTRDALKLSEREFMDCVNLYTSVYSKTGNIINLSEDSAKLISGKYIIDESKLLPEIRKKCKRPADIVRQNLQEIKKAWGQLRITSFKMTKDQTNEMAELSTQVERETLNAMTTNYPIRTELPNHENELGSKLYKNNFLPHDERAVENSLDPSRKNNSKENQILTTQIPTATESLQSSENYSTTQLSLFTTSKLIYDQVLINDNSNNNSKIVTVMYDNGEHNGANESSEDVSIKFLIDSESHELYEKIHKIENNATTTADIFRVEIDLNQNYKVALANNKTNDHHNDISKTVSSELIKGNKTSKSNESDIVENMTSLPERRNQYVENYSTEFYHTQVTDDSSTLKSEKHYKEQIGHNNSFVVDKSSEYNTDMVIVATESVVNSTEISQNDGEISTNVNTLKASSDKVTENYIYILPTNTFANTQDTHELQGTTVAVHGFSHYDLNGITTALPAINTYPKDTVGSDEEIPLPKSINTSAEDNFENDLNGFSTTTITNDIADSYMHKNYRDTISPRMFSSLHQLDNSTAKRKSNDYNLRMIEDYNEINLFSSDPFALEQKTEATTSIETEIVHTTTNSYPYYEENNKITTEKRPTYILSKQTDHHFTTALEFKPQITKRENNLLSNGMTSSIETKLEKTYNYGNDYGSEVTKISPEFLRLTPKVETLKNQKKKMNEIRNDSAHSDSNIDDFQNKKREYTILSDDTSLKTTNNEVHSAYTEKDLVSGNIFIVFNKTNIPARFLQNDKGELSIGIDGPTLCDKLNMKKHLLINMICNCFLHKNCSNSHRK